MKTLVIVILIMILITALSSDVVTLLRAIIPDFQVSEFAEIPAGGGRPSISVDGKGNFIITWKDYRNGNGDIYAQRYSNDGTALESNYIVNNDQGSVSHQNPSISADGSGNYVIVWEDERNGNYDIYGQRYTENGSAQGSNFRVNDDQGSAWQASPSISLNDNGKFIITWHDERNGHTDIYAQRYSSDGTPLENNFKVNNDQDSLRQHNASISMDDSGNFCITWGDERNGNWDIYAQRFSNDGIPLGNNFKVNDEQGSNDHNYPSISTSSIGNFIISWWDGRSGGGDIYAQRYLGVGTPLESNFKVNDDQGSSDQWSTKISLSDSGDFIITWWDTRNSDRDIYAQCYSSDGKILGSNFLVTNTGDGLQRYPDVELWNNNIYNTWEDDRGSETGCAIWANVLNWNDLVEKIDNELSQIPTEFVLHQNYPNPFNPSTKIKFSLPKPETVKIEVYNTLGQKIETLLDQNMKAGFHEIEFNAQNLSSGIYFYRIEAGEFQDVKKMIFLK